MGIDIMSNYTHTGKKKEHQLTVVCLIVFFCSSLKWLSIVTKKTLGC